MCIAIALRTYSTAELLKLEGIAGTFERGIRLVNDDLRLCTNMGIDLSQPCESASAMMRGPSPGAEPRTAVMTIAKGIARVHFAPDSDMAMTRWDMSVTEFLNEGRTIVIKHMTMKSMKRTMDTGGLS